MIKRRGLAEFAAFGVVEIPNDRAIDLEAAAGARNSHAAIVVDEAVAGRTFEKPCALGPIGSFGRQAAWHLHEARDVTQRVEQEGRERIQQEVDQLRSDLQKQSAVMAREIARRVLGREVA